MELKKSRSPAYPSLSLDAAIAKAREIYNSYNTAFVHREAAAVAIGYAPTSGSSFGALASLSAYGLVDGRRGEVGVSDLAIQIFFAESEEERAEALQKAVSMPPAFGLISDRFGEHIPPAKGIEDFLCRNRFTPPAAAKAAKSYITSVKFVTSTIDNDRKESAAKMPENAASKVGAKPAQTQDADETNTEPTGVFQEWARGSAGISDNDFRLLAKNKPSSDEWHDIIALLEVQAKIAERREEAQAQKGEQETKLIEHIPE